MKLHISNQRQTQFIPYRLGENGLEIALANNALPVQSGRFQSTASVIDNGSFKGRIQPKLVPIINCNDEPYLTASTVYPVLVTESNHKFVSLDEAMDIVDTESSHTLANFATDLLETQSKLIEGSSHKFQNINILLHSLGSNSYRLEWSSKMTGSSTSLAKVSPVKWTVIRKWAENRRMSDISQVFDNRKQALYHFLSNTDIVKTSDDMVEAAKRKAIELFLELEGQKPQVVKRIPRQRLQGAIGSRVEIRDSLNGKRVIAKGVLMQLIKDLAEVRIDEYIDLPKRHVFYKASANRVYIT